MTPTEMHIDSLTEKIEKLQAENARYREALEFYANNGGSLLADVGGRRAREALKGE